MTASPLFPAALEQGHPGADPRAFRRSLGQFATGVTVMTTTHGQEPVGMSVNSFAALSLDPPLVLWSIRKESRQLDAFRASGHYAVNILAEHQVELSNLFAKPDDKRFDKVRWTQGRLGAPLLAGVIGTLECKLDQLIDGGDHYVLVGRVEHYAIYPGKPLLFSQGRYGVTAELMSPLSPEGSADKSPASTPWLEEATLLRKLHWASQLMSSKLDAVRALTGLSVAAFRIYGWLRLHGMSEAELSKRLYVGENEFQEAISGMQACGHLMRDAAGFLSLTPAGKIQSDRNAEHVRAVESRLFEGVGSEDIRATHQTLSHMIEQIERSALE